MINLKIHSINTNKDAFMFLAVIIFFLIGCYQSYYIVHPGYTVLHKRMGSIIHVREEAAFYFKMPFVDEIIPICSRILRAKEETRGLSHDLQSVSVGMVINYRIIDPLKMFITIGADVKRVIIDPFTEETVKAIIAEFTAENLIQHRHIAKDKVITDLRARLKPMFIDLVDFNFTHLNFSGEFMHAVESKQIAEQHAKQAKNRSEQIKEEAMQMCLKADAEAYSQRIKKETITPDLIQMMAIEKWDGKLPVYSSGNLPFISVK